MNLSLKNLMGGLIAALLLSDCSEEQGLMPAWEHSNTVIEATSQGHAGVQTRTLIGGVAENGNLVMQWAPSEKVGVFGNSSVNVPFTSDNTAPANQVNFSGTIVATDVPKYAYYPYQPNVTDVKAIPVTIPVEQTYADVTSIGQYDVKAATVIESQTNGRYKMTFQQMATLIRLQINLSTVNGLAVTEKLQQIEMSGSSVLAGDFTYDLNQVQAGLVQKTTQNKVLLVMANQPVLSERVTAYVVVAPGAQQNEVFHFVLTTDKNTVEFDAQLNSTLQAGFFYDLPLNATVLTQHQAVVKPKPVTPAPDQPVTEETANCYMIHTTGEHSFVATQIGNGDKGIIPNAGFHVSSSKINPQSAKLMWEDTPGFIDANSIRLEQGRVYYTANKNVGNAQIAVYSGPQCTGDILWSWHIWGVGDTLPSDEAVTNFNGAVFQMMDRTLGAHSLTSYTTTLYQWGRKDPFPNSATYYVDGQMKDISATYPVFAPKTAAEASISNSVAHCNAIMSNNPSSDSNWLAEDNRYLWGDNNDESIWGTIGGVQCGWPDYLATPNLKAENTKGWTHKKTIYDPSPVGYRVASKFVWTGFVKNNDGSTPSSSFSSSKLERVNFVKFDNGYYFKKDAADATGTYYPMAGWRTASDGGLMQGGSSNQSAVTKNGFYWSSALGRNPHEGHCLVMTEYQPSDNGQNSLNEVNTLDAMYKWTACAVRCVRE